ncbi:hypothetical protein [[Mycobacterium] wendilense]|uniref:Uncharacterized protein n=1 Tax=[Mycobacterium] wendilense TaxID=3064284 RepID=A0ABM9M876_9MYCO|nr:hypothetical protein [Mycolicibacterium sp. MU0050]CAJ1578703.1 hypothetical protein MU0050_000166 [Mycolicibacterium sp. MU0050]
MSRLTRACGIALIAAGLVGCTQTTPGQLAKTTEPVSPDLTCSEFEILPPQDKVKVINEIVKASPGDPSLFLVMLASVLCERAPEQPVKEVLLRLR